ncbi:hypothetical protein GCM10011410_31960 [Hoyosella rhizosphaerae]|uniref:Uncharacterized protein n=1 Tax=Hoyosella rhizosphaerae TaxID=1755582 RepID=A0A916XIR3_9ACTN|nr:hypothetical protein GCM10011410_31960 [Hoyosella rhizosphaerae]
MINKKLSDGGVALYCAFKPLKCRRSRNAIWVRERGNARVQISGDARVRRGEGCGCGRRRRTATDKRRRRGYHNKQGYTITQSR